MAGFTSSLEQSLLSHVFRPGVPYTAPTSLQLGLATADPGEGTSAANSPTGYTRPAITFGAPSTDASFVTRVSNTTVITVNFTITQIITHFFITNQAGTMLFTGALPAPVTVEAGQGLQWAVGLLILELT